MTSGLASRSRLLGFLFIATFTLFLFFFSASKENFLCFKIGSRTFFGRLFVAGSTFFASRSASISISTPASSFTFISSFTPASGYSLASTLAPASGSLVSTSTPASGPLAPATFSSIASHRKISFRIQAS